MVRRGLVASVFCTLVLLGVAGEAAAEIRPSFWLEDLTWNATHIVIASEGDVVDGRLTVIESLVGPLAPGAELELPALAAFAPAERRREYDLFQTREDCVTVTGRRMILFLQREEGPGEWKPAATCGDLDVCVCWIESGAAYGLMQVMNPGPTRMTSLETTEEAIRVRIRRLRETRAALDEVRAITDKEKRAAAALAYVGESYLVQHAAFEILRGCGRVATPHLLALACRPEPASVQWPAFEALGEIGDPATVRPLVALLEDELVFWRQAGGHLESGWWNGKGLDPDGRKRHVFHYRRVHASLVALARIAAPGFEDVVRRTRALWRSTPALHEIGAGQIEEQCDEALAALE